MPPHPPFTLLPPFPFQLPLTLETDRGKNSFLLDRRGGRAKRGVEINGPAAYAGEFLKASPPPKFLLLHSNFLLSPLVRGGVDASNDDGGARSKWRKGYAFSSFPVVVSASSYSIYNPDCRSECLAACLGCLLRVLPSTLDRGGAKSGTWTRRGTCVGDTP